MRLLLVNTCGSDNLVALASEAGVITEQALPARGSSEALFPAIRRLFAEAAFGVHDLDAVGVVIGPGSFTGVRVGLSAAKGLCEAAGLRMIAMSRLALVASAVDAEDVLAVLDAGRGEFYCGHYRQGACLWEKLLDQAELGGRMANLPAVTCEARVAEQLEVPLVDEPGANTMLRMSLARIAAGDWTDVATVDARYLRRTDAELLGKSK